MTRITVEILLLHAFLTLLGYMAVAVICLTVTKVQTDIPLFLLLSATIFYGDRLRMVLSRNRRF